MTLHDEMQALAEKTRAFEAAMRERYGERVRVPPRDEARDAGVPADLLTVGLVGGTGVGKSSLVNALAGRDVSSTSSRRPTTSRIVPYVHRDRRTALEAIPALREHLSTRIVVHDVDQLRSLALFDLPDIDSVADEHARVVRAALDGLDVVVWVTSITKYADRVFHAWIRDHVADRDADNFVFVLNKVDEIDEPDPAAGAARLEKHFRDAVGESLGTARSRGEPAFFTVSALRHGQGVPGDRLEALRAFLFRERDALELERIKSSNRQAELTARLDRLGSDLALEEREEALADEERFVAAEIAVRLEDESLMEQLQGALRAGSAQSLLARRYFAAAIAGWPLLPRLQVLASPIRQIPRTLGLLATFVKQQVVGEDETDGAGDRDPLLRALVEIESARRRRRSRRLDPRIPLPAVAPAPEEIERTRRRLQNECDTRLKDEVEDELAKRPVPLARPGPTKHLLIWLPLIWFPFLQPMLETLLDPTAALASLPQRLAYRLFVILGAMHLLVSLIFVALVYVAYLVGIHARARARARARCRAILDTDWWKVMIRERLEEALLADVRGGRSVVDEERVALEALRAESAALEARIQSP